MKGIAKRFKKEISLLIALIMAVLGLSTYITYVQLNRSLGENYLDKLSTLKHSLNFHLQSYFDAKSNVISLSASNPTTAEAISAFENSFYAAESEHRGRTDTAVLKESVKRHISKIRFDVPNAQNPRKPDDYLPNGKNGKILQTLYISQNPFRAQERYRLFRSDQGLSYDTVHERYHDFFLHIQQRHRFYDLFLIDMQGNIIYSVMKEFDFATNLSEGPYAASSLGNAYKKALSLRKSGVVFSDFAPYSPSYNKPASFMASPVFEGKKKIGVIAFQIPIDDISAAMTLNNTQKESGLGESGEAYLIGNDYYMRSDSRFVGTMRDPLVNELGTTIGIIQVKSVMAQKALSGENSSLIAPDYRGVEVYSSYMPLKLFDTSWAIMVEMDAGEVKKSINQTAATILATSLLLILLFLALLGFLVLRLVVKPIRENEALLSKNIRMQRQELNVSEALLEEYKKAVDTSAIVSKADPKGIITYVNDAFCAISGYAREELIGRSHSIIRHPGMPSTVFEEMWRTILHKRAWKGIIRNRTKEGGEYYVQSTIVPILDDKNDIAEFISIRSDITDLIHKERQLVEQTTDATTGLPNRIKLLEDIARIDESIKLSIIQLKKFKEINEFYGAEIADKMLVSITSVLKGLLEGNGFKLYKISHDEFAVMGPSPMKTEDFSKKMSDIIKYFDHNVVTVNDNHFHVAMTIGLASGEKEKIFVNAEMALSKAIENETPFLAYENSHDLEKQYQQNIRTTSLIKEAIKNDGIIVYAQRITPNFDNGKAKYECLVRLFDGTKVLSPFFFLEVAKRNRLYPTITRIIIEKSFECFAHRKEEFSINLSIQDILNPDLVAFLKKKIHEYKVGHRLVIELIESEGIENFDEVTSFIQEVKSLGCKIAIDDFGTGYSNFEYLMKLHVDYIKIDGSLIKNIHTDPHAQLIVELIVEFAKRIGMMTIAEFVHSEEVQNKIKELGVDYSQGFLLHEPAACSEMQS